MLRMRWRRRFAAGWRDFDAGTPNGGISMLRLYKALPTECRINCLLPWRRLLLAKRIRFVHSIVPTPFLTQPAVYAPLLDRSNTLTCRRPGDELRAAQVCRAVLKLGDFGNGLASAGARLRQLTRKPAMSKGLWSLRVEAHQGRSILVLVSRGDGDSVSAVLRPRTAPPRSPGCGRAH